MIKAFSGSAATAGLAARMSVRITRLTRMIFFMGISSCGS
jgi:hypothetical protein